MKKIMFNDKFGLTQAVLEGGKTMTRRIIPRKILDNSLIAMEVILKAPYKIGEVVAVAQPYKVLDYNFHGFATNPSLSCGIRKEYAEKQKGWGNKMFVESKFMPRLIRITDIKVERMQDISDEDCLKEGVYYCNEPNNSHEYDPYCPWPPTVQPYKYAIDNFKFFCNPQYAFAHLINKVSGKGTWESNPWVFAYTFELID